MEIRVMTHGNSGYDPWTRPLALASRGLRGRLKGFKGLKGQKGKRGRENTPSFFSLLSVSREAESIRALSLTRGRRRRCRRAIPDRRAARRHAERGDVASSELNAGILRTPLCPRRQARARTCTEQEELRPCGAIGGGSPLPPPPLLPSTYVPTPKKASTATKDWGYPPPAAGARNRPV